MKTEQFIPFSGYHEQDHQKTLNNIDSILEEFSFDGTEVYISHVVPREQPLFSTRHEKKVLIDNLREWKAKRIHLSYWAEPTDFLQRVDYPKLVERFGGEEGVMVYYGDLTGEKVFSRWVQEYEVAREIKAVAGVFHLIDYFHIDGLWRFTNTRETIVKAMVATMQRFLDELDKRNLLEDGPVIELENAGFGLEYGVQTAEDFNYIFKNINDSYNKLRIGWDINHLLHAIGYDTIMGRVRFFLPDEEITYEMRSLEKRYGDEIHEFALQWVKQNILDKRIIDKVSAIHLSDNTAKTTEFFRKGQLTGKYLSEIQNLKDNTAREEYGVNIVLNHYDSHEPLGVTLKKFPEIIGSLSEYLTRLTILHELKNNELDRKALQKQMKNMI